MSKPKLYGVNTTKIVCRFGCPSRLPKPSNVLFFNSLEDAINKGFRLCKRCRPDKVSTPVEEFQKFIIEQFRWCVEEFPMESIEKYAYRLSISKRQLERIAKSQLNISPRKAILSRKIYDSK